MEKSEYMNRVEKRNRVYEGFGAKHSLPEWAAILGISRTSVWRYVSKGLTIEEIAHLRHVEPKKEG